MRALPLMLALVLSGCTTGDPNKPQSTGLRPVKRAAKAPFPDTMSPDVQDYLTELYGQIQPWWHAGLQKAKTSYPEDHCIHDKELRAVVVMRFDDADKPGIRTVERKSGCKLFDETALSMLDWFRNVPRRPGSLKNKEGLLLLRWSFHRDKRGCEPAFADLIVESFAPHVQLHRALTDKKWDRAREILTGAEGRQVRWVLAARGLNSAEPRVRRLALGIAPTERVEEHLRTERSKEVWEAGVDLLERRKATVVLVRVLGEIAMTGTKGNAPRIIRLLEMMKRLKTTLPDQVLDSLLTYPVPDVVLHSFEHVTKLTTLKRNKAAWKAKPGMMGALAVRWCSLSKDMAAAGAIRKALAGPERSVVLKALELFPLPDLAGDVAKLAGSKTPASDRVMAIQILSRTKTPSQKPLFLALTSDDPALQIAAARALSKRIKNRRGTTYRLAHVAQRSKNLDVAAAALAAMARVGFEKRRRDLGWLMARIPIGKRVPIVRNMWAYGEPAVKSLLNLGRTHAPLRAAAIDSLRRIPGDAAKKAHNQLTALPLHHAAASGTPPASKPGPLEQLLLEVVASK